MSPGLGQAGRSGVREADLARDQIAAALPPGVHVSVREPRPETPLLHRLSEGATPWDPGPSSVSISHFRVRGLGGARVGASGGPGPGGVRGWHGASASMGFWGIFSVRPQEPPSALGPLALSQLIKKT